MKDISKIIILLLLFQICCYVIYKNEKIEVNEISNNIKVNYIDKIKNITKDDSIGNIVIEKINLDKKLYEMNNEKNNVDLNVTILEGSIEPNKDNSIMFIAAHSGDGENAYFRNLNDLEINDEIILNYKGYKYTYKVIDKWEEKKDGDIEINKTNEKQLVLTTCSTKNKYKQLVINCIEKESK